MSTETYTVIVCDSCGERGPEVLHGPPLPFHKLYELAAGYGWESKDGNDYCQLCMEEKEAEDNE